MALEIGVHLRSMPKVEDLDQLSALIDPVVDPDRRMQNLTQAWTLNDRATYVRKVFQEFQMVQKTGAETVRSRPIIEADIVENFFEIF